MSDQPRKKAPPQEPDTTAELWDRLAEDILRQGAPCLETVEKLVDEACQRDPGPGPRKKPE